MDVVVSSNVDGELETALSSDGTFLGSVFLTKGEHTLTAQVTDSYGVPNAITESVSITVGGPNNDPTCQITAPDPDLAVAVEESFSLEGLILDMDLAYEFYPEPGERDVGEQPRGRPPHRSAGHLWTHDRADRVAPARHAPDHPAG